ncbi:HAD-superfamily hydrolase, subfamily IIA, CECR5 [Cordyceps fumosorosea ARSEF 2679]|uniref:HAD-superfamily hydrolase, subfamily IIA, CECR5 n=1 Tax=Cordyceps fumosorosea (strain ARSEF 2679) TaxID=1081104 RepID=A0A167TJ56_CORFA|nr:HAD-superfamily hydrolase, subfamily IIA, CECR5 [Cordyceps fumosorosea ARSEF 2679]OAA60650.1 HAD-superfamily hydrolase, subfamily IIA, CECR5 [Cordyceps fumosorosea ARSEF 2679]
MVHGRVLGTRLGPRCQSLLKAGVLRCSAPAEAANVVPKTVHYRAFSITPQTFRERKPLGKDESIAAVTNGAEPAINPAFADIAFAFDIDGVLYKGQEGIPGAREMLQKIRQQGLRYVFLTNGGGAHENAKAASLAKRLGIENPEYVLKDRVILSHTPMRGWDDDIKKNGTVLITASQPETARQLARQYGFQRAVTPADLIAANPHIYPFAHLRDSLHKETSPLPDGKSAAAITDPYSRSIPPDALKVDQILVWNDPRDWALDIQVIHDLLVSHRGYLGTLSSHNGDASLADAGWQQDGQPALWISNLDLVWRTEHPVNRFGTGAFLEALKGVWAGVTGGAAPLRYRALGKPSRHTYEYAHERLLRGDGGRKPLRRVYMVGDNPESDIRGANEFAPRDGASWESILVRTGVFQPTETEPEPRYKPTVVVDDVVDAVVWALRNEGADVSREWLLSA